jgi:sensor c-di-GMP phosphodiesterase-like protein
VAAADLSDSEFLSMLGCNLQQVRGLARSLAIEITKSSKVRCYRRDHLCKKGHDVLYQRFATGYSGQAYLYDLFVVEIIKIDRVFTQAISTEAVTVSLLLQIPVITAVLNLEVIVEGKKLSSKLAILLWRR